jgi:hypothetical protein
MKEAELAGYRPLHFRWSAEERVDVITLSRLQKPIIARKLLKA